MNTFSLGVGAAVSLALGTAALCASNPFIGRWDFDLQTPSGAKANWLGVSEKSGKLEVWFQPTGGNVREIPDARFEGNHLSFIAAAAKTNEPAMTWDLTAANGKLTGAQNQGSESVSLTGVRAPELNRNPPKAWGPPQPLFNGKNLNGWEPIGDKGKSHWIVKDGVLLNEEHGANLKSTRSFEDFEVHFEVNCPDEANSGFYLRGRYEMQLAYEPQKKEPPDRTMGAIYGRIAPEKDLPATPNHWESFDVTLVGRTVTIVRNGTMIVNAKEIEGITGGALDADEGKPGPFYIQGDHTGGLKFRNITVSEPKK
ncbi:MAG: DUF1080 domain-containing protein [Bryobacteraceae bacterium]